MVNMTVYPIEALTNDIKLDLMAYIWSGEGEEIAAAENLHNIFNTLEKIAEKYNDVVTDRDYYKEMYHTGHIEICKLKKEIERLKNEEEELI